MKIIFLGTSAAIPNKSRNLSSIALKYESDIILFDCGEDTQRKFVEAGLKFNKPLVVLISHFHGDHVIGLPGLLFRFGLSERSAPVVLIGPKNLFLYTFLHRKILGLKTKYPLKIIEIDNENKNLIVFEDLDSEQAKNTLDIKDDIVFETKKYIIKYSPVIHSILNFAYSFIEKPRPGKFYPERAKDLGIPMSNLWKKLQDGEIIEFQGKVIDPFKEGIIGPKKPGRKITYTGDTMPCESLIDLGKDSEILIHESTFAKDLAETAKEKAHSTSIDAANDAKNMNAKQLVLTHISSRYQEEAVKLLEEARGIFPNTILAKDLLEITLK